MPRAATCASSWREVKSSAPAHGSREQGSGERTSPSAAILQRPCLQRTRADSPVAAAAAIPADLIGVDLLPTATGHIVLELNGAVDFDHRYSLPDRSLYIDIARALALADGSGALRTPRTQLRSSPRRLSVVPLSAGRRAGDRGVQPMKGAVMAAMRAVGNGHKLPPHARVREAEGEYMIKLDVSDFTERELRSRHSGRD